MRCSMLFVTNPALIGASTGQKTGAARKGWSHQGDRTHQWKRGIVSTNFKARCWRSVLEKVNGHSKESHCKQDGERLGVSSIMLHFHVNHNLGSFLNVS